MDRGRLVGLDALRGIAALIVTIGHLDFINNRPLSFDRSYLMVDFFFMLSGYIMARTYENRLGDEISAAGFVFLRFKRLWTPVAIGVIIGAYCYWFRHFGLERITILVVLAFLFMPDIYWFPGTFPMNGPAWSVHFELVANWLHAKVLRKLSCRVLFAMATASALAIQVSEARLDVGSENTFWLGFPRILMDYSIGIVIWRMMGDEPRWPAWPAFVGVPVALYLYSTAFYDHSYWLDLPFALLVCPLALISGLGMQENDRFAWFASAGGALSFPLYAVHFPIMDLVYFRGGPPWFGLLLSFAVAALVSIFLEKRLKPKLPRSTASV